MIPVSGPQMQQQLKEVENLILSEVNVKSVDYLSEDANILVKKIKPNFKTLGPRHGKLMKQIALLFAGFTQQDIRSMEVTGAKTVMIGTEAVDLTLEDVEIMTEDIPGWSVASQGKLTVALDMTLTTALVQEGLARELVNRVQNMRKDAGFEVTDHIELQIESSAELNESISTHAGYICSETLAHLEIVNQLSGAEVTDNEITETIRARILIKKSLV
jgi:isoleucyl-tRNA synthetase